uniref:Uncharacterized protein LOC114337886 n=1 Tax=Diabrotica virgifera virgifera TaxID=50390 RepID=A0A6P7G5H7_DIAVI
MTFPVKFIIRIAEFVGSSVASCINCLRKNHRVLQCTASNCGTGRQKHNSLLHFDKPKRTSNNNKNTNTDIPSASVNLHSHVATEVLLATAVVDIVNGRGKAKTCRVCLDAGSQAHFITEALAQFLNLDKKTS